MIHVVLRCVLDDRSLRFPPFEDRFDIEMEPADWLDLLGADQESADRIFDLLGAIADGADVEFLRAETDEGDIRLVLRAW